MAKNLVEKVGVRMLRLGGYMKSGFVEGLANTLTSRIRPLAIQRCIGRTDPFCQFFKLVVYVTGFLENRFLTPLCCIEPEKNMFPKTDFVYLGLKMIPGPIPTFLSLTFFPTGSGYGSKTNRNTIFSFSRQKR